MIATAMHAHDTHLRRECRSRRLRVAVRAPAWAALAAWGAAVTLAASFEARACGYHDPASVSVGVLNWAYPDALHVRTAVWMAQDSGLLPRREPLPEVGPLSVTFRFQQSIRLRDAQAQLGEVGKRVDAVLAGQPMSAFAVVLIGPMLWTRFESTDGRVNMISHATGPVGDDIVIVTDEAVVAALAEGRITAHEARAQGLVKTYGNRERADRLSALLDRTFE